MSSSLSLVNGEGGFTNLLEGASLAFSATREQVIAKMKGLRLQLSDVIRENRELQVQLARKRERDAGGNSSILTQNHPNKKRCLAIHNIVVPTHSKCLTVRTTDDPPMPAQVALQMLKDGNARFLRGEVEAKVVCASVRGALKNQGQRPAATILSCADSRVALDFVFDTNPGDLFVVRNAGNVCGAPSGGLIGSIEYSVGHLQTQLVVVLGHTNCGAVAAATGTRLAKSTEGLSDCLKALVERLELPVDEAIEQLPGADQSDIVELGIKLNVWHTIKELIQSSSVLKASLLAGKLEIHGGVYCLEKGHVEWMGQHPEQQKLLDVPAKSDDN